MTYQEHVAQLVRDRMTVDAMWIEEQLREAWDLHDGSPLALTVVDHRFSWRERPVRSVASLWPQRQAEAS